MASTSARRKHKNFCVWLMCVFACYVYGMHVKRDNFEGFSDVR